MKLTIQSAKELIFDLTLFFNSLKILLLRRDCFAGGKYLFGVRIGCLSLSGTGVSSKLIFFFFSSLSITPPPCLLIAVIRSAFLSLYYPTIFFCFAISLNSRIVFFSMVLIYIHSVIFKYSRENNIFLLTNLYVKF